MKTLLKIAFMIIIALVLVKAGKNLKKADFVKHGAIKTMNIGITDIALDKEDCEDAASYIVNENLIEGMSEKSVAKEIYAHIFIHDIIDNLPSALRNNSIVNRVYNGIDLEDFGDTFVRQIAYIVIWFLG